MDERGGSYTGMMIQLENMILFENLFENLGEIMQMESQES